MYFSADRVYDLLINKAKILENDLIREKVLSKKVERGKDLGQYIAQGGWIISQGYPRGYLLTTPVYT